MHEVIGASTQETRREREEDAFRHSPNLIGAQLTRAIIINILTPLVIPAAARRSHAGDVRKDCESLSPTPAVGMSSKCHADTTASSVNLE
jgi:hypothetical protein